MTFDLNAYFKRIGLSECSSNLAGLKALQRAQIMAMPFENVLPFTGRVPALDQESLWRKLVLEKCGGYCFELNGLLGEALEALGFHAQRVLARVRMGAPEGGARTHLAFVVTLDGAEWLVDAGFGGQAPREPICISNTAAQTIEGNTYRIRFEETSTEHVLERQKDKGWFPLYGFDRVDVRQVDIEASNYLCATSPNESFSANLKISAFPTPQTVSFVNGNARFTDETGSTEEKILEAEPLKRFFQDKLALGYDDETIEHIARRLAALN